MTPEDVKRLAANPWFGYGRWDAPHWFIGKEPGGKDDPENYASWFRLGGSELVACRDHDLEYNGPDRGRWHLGERPRLQPIWRLLIALLSAFKSNDPYDVEAVRRYQALEWGSTDGETAVLELSGVAAPSVASDDVLRLIDVDGRIARLGEMIKAHCPQFVVMYGLGTDPINTVSYLSHWSRIAGVALTPSLPVRLGATAFVAAPHSTAHGSTTDFWTTLGRALRNLRGT